MRRRAKCISKEKRRRYDGEKGLAVWEREREAGKKQTSGASGWFVHTTRAMAVFVASDWLKRRWIKACHVLSIHYLKKKHFWAGKSLLFSLFLFDVSTSVKKEEKPVLLLTERKEEEEEPGEKKIILSVIEVYNVQSSSTLPLDHYFIRRDVTLSTTSDT